MAGGAGVRRCLCRGTLAVAVLGALAVAALFVLSQCSGSAGESDRALPPGFEELGAPNVETNVYIYSSFDGSRALPLSAVGAAASGEEDVISIEALVLDPDADYTARFRMADGDGAARLATASVSGGEGRWTSDGAYAYFSREESAWSGTVREAWEEDDRLPLAEWDVAVWDALQLLPERPPAPPFAAGFTRNSGGVAERLLSVAKVEAPGLGAGLALLRIDPVAFAAYGKLSPLPADLGDTLLQPGVSALAVGRSSYPGALVAPVFDGFAGASGMEKIELEGESLRYTVLEGGMHLMVKAYGPTFYFAVSPTREGAEGVIRSVIERRRDEEAEGDEGGE